MRKALVFALVALAFYGCLAITWIGVRETSAIKSELQAQQMAYEVEQPFENHAIDGMVDVAQAGYAANVAIAASGDMAQASMMKSFTFTIWGFGFTVAAFGFVILALRKKNEEDA